MSVVRGPQRAALHNADQTGSARVVVQATRRFFFYEFVEGFHEQQNNGWSVVRPAPTLHNGTLPSESTLTARVEEGKFITLYHLDMRENGARPLYIVVGDNGGLRS